MESYAKRLNHPIRAANAALVALGCLLLGGCPGNPLTSDSAGTAPASNQVAGFSPEANGFHFNNMFPLGTTYPAITLPVAGTIYTADAYEGICDGFVLATLDMYLHDPPLTPPLDATPPADGTELFTYLSEREVDCWLADGSRNAWKALSWTHTPSQDTVFETPFGPVLFARGVGWRTAAEEWPRVKADIDAGRPSPLWLVTMPPCPGLDLQRTIKALIDHHQVLAYGYSLDDSANLTLNIYDPNVHDSESPVVTLNISDPGDGVDIAVPSMPWATVRGFFRSGYDLQDARAIAGE